MTSTPLRQAAVGRASLRLLPLLSTTLCALRKCNAGTMAPCRLSDLAIIKAAADGDLCLLKQMAGQMDLREAKDDEGKNALHAAAAMGHLEVCRFLVEESGFDVNCTTANGVTPVACAAAAGNVGVLRYLLDHDGDPAMSDARGTTPLHYAADLGHYEAVRLLLSKGVEVEGLNSHGSPPLQLAAGKGHDQAVQVLLEHGADPNRVIHNMFSPLIVACCGGSFKCTKLLVEAGADVNFKNSFGMTALSMADSNGLTDIVKLLLKAGAGPNISDKDKKRTIADARPEGNQAFARGDYLAATFSYTMALLKNPYDATLVSNRSLCWLRLGDGKLALFDAQLCKTMRPRWSKAWYREGAALSLLKDYEGAVNAFTEALKHDPGNDEIKKALREATDSLTNAGYSGEQNPRASASMRFVSRQESSICNLTLWGSS